MYGATEQNHHDNNENNINCHLQKLKSGNMEKQ